MSAPTNCRGEIASLIISRERKRTKRLHSRGLSLKAEVHPVPMSHAHQPPPPSSHFVTSSAQRTKARQRKRGTGPSLRLDGHLFLSIFPCVTVHESEACTGPLAPLASTDAPPVPCPAYTIFDAHYYALELHSLYLTCL